MATGKLEVCNGSDTTSAQSDCTSGCNHTYSYIRSRVGGRGRHARLLAIDKFAQLGTELCGFL